MIIGLFPGGSANDKPYLTAAVGRGDITIEGLQGLKSPADSGQLQVDLYPIPDAVYQLRFDMVIPQAALDADATFLKIPSNPVIQLAYALALRERGETGGQSAGEQFGVASIALGDAIQLDANKYQNELTFVAV